MPKYLIKDIVHSYLQACWRASTPGFDECRGITTNFVIFFRHDAIVNSSRSKCSSSKKQLQILQEASVGPSKRVPDL